MAERITFADGEMPYHSMLAAEHLARYALASSVCKGRHVLDIACGEGYGSAYLADAGAASVLGVDISAQAITTAKSRFTRDGIDFRIGDALDPDSWHSGERFDVVVCFETIEHVNNPKRFLQFIREVLKPDGTIIISCPNDAIDAQRGISNPFHSSVFSFHEFKEITTEVLGPAAQWLLATPITGLIALEQDDKRLDNRRTSLDQIFEGEEVPQSIVLPSQPEHSASNEDVTFYVGVWNGRVGHVQVTAPMSKRAYLDPWIALTEKDREIERLKAEREALRELVKRAGERVKEVRRIAELEMAVAAERRSESDSAVLYEIKQLAEFRSTIINSRAHKLASAYISLVQARSRPARVLRAFALTTLRLIRPLRLR